jgi:YebC/PmpR family DNA-binding regulatory protein
MAGHSKWHQIKHKKGAADQKRGLLFSKLVKAISIAARGNPNPDANPRLRSAIEKARAANVPYENIERALKRSRDTENLDELVIEAYGPEKTALIIEGITDSKNRTIAEIKKVLEEHDSKMADPGSVLWAFSHDGGEWKAKFPQTISPEARQRLETLTNSLEERDDVQKIISNAS